MKTKFIIWGILWASVIALACFYGCESKVESLSGNGEKINRAELTFELENYLRMAELRYANLDTQDAVRDIVFKNALLVFQTGTISPTGIGVAVAAIYGLISGGTTATKYVKKKVINP